MLGFEWSGTLWVGGGHIPLEDEGEEKTQYISNFQEKIQYKKQGCKRELKRLFQQSPASVCNSLIYIS